MFSTNRAVILINQGREKVILIHGGCEKVIWAEGRKKGNEAGAEGRGKVIHVFYKNKNEKKRNSIEIIQTM